MTGKLTLAQGDHLWTAAINDVRVRLQDADALLLVEWVPDAGDIRTGTAVLRLSRQALLDALRSARFPYVQQETPGAWQR